MVPLSAASESKRHCFFRCELLKNTYIRIGECSSGSMRMNSFEGDLCAFLIAPPKKGGKCRIVSVQNDREVLKAFPIMTLRLSLSRAAILFHGTCFKYKEKKGSFCIGKSCGYKNEKQQEGTVDPTGNLYASFSVGRHHACGGFGS